MIFKKEIPILKDEEKIEQLLKRGVHNVYPNEDFLRNLLKSGKRLTLYLGIDPTGPTLHIGHAITLRKLKEFQDLGHKIILLIGDFTATIGDPTDKSKTRKQLTRDEVLKNAELYKEQASVFLKFRGSNAAELRYNSEWLGKMKFEDVLNLASRVTVEQMAKRDMFVERAKSGNPVFIHEFMYPLMQGYDAVAMEVDGEVGGSDQTFNMLVGRDLVKQIQNREKFVVTTKLLEDPTGKKMGKTEGNMITLQDSPEDMYGKVMSWSDEMLPVGFELCTYTPEEELEKIKSELSSSKNPKEIKMRLAREIVSIYHGEEGATLAEEQFQKTFSDGGIPDEIETIVVDSEETLADALVREKLVTSKSDLRRLVESGAVRDAEKGEKLTDKDLSNRDQRKLKIGKRRFVEINFE